MLFEWFKVIVVYGWFEENKKDVYVLLYLLGDCLKMLLLVVDLKVF